MEIMFKSAYSKKESITQEPGRKEAQLYGYEINSKGQKELRPTGTKDLYAEIQAQAEDTKIENILKKVAIGDYSDFRANAIYQDISEIPNNLIEARKQMQELENVWTKLPAEIKAKYDNSVETFIAESGKESWLIDMGFIKPVETETNKKQVNSELNDSTKKESSNQE